MLRDASPHRCRELTRIAHALLAPGQPLRGVAGEGAGKGVRLYLGEAEWRNLVREGQEPQGGLLRVPQLAIERLHRRARVRVGVRAHQGGGQEREPVAVPGGEEDGVHALRRAVLELHLPVCRHAGRLHRARQGGE